MAALSGHAAGLTRYTWANLPEHLRQAIQEYAGELRRELPAGLDGEYAATLVTTRTTVYVRAVPTHQMERVAALRRVIRAERYLPPSAPRLLWTIERLDWVVAAYEHVQGRVPDYAPRSRDLPAVVEHLAALGTHTPSGVAGLETFAARWNKFSPWATLSSMASREMTQWDHGRLSLFCDVEKFLVEVLWAGCAVVNANPHPGNVLVGESGARLVDWTWAARGPAWLDTAMFVVDLILTGHSPRDAEVWAARVPAWRAANRDVLDAFAVGLLGAYLVTSQRPRMVEAARLYAAYRRGECR